MIKKKQKTKPQSKTGGMGESGRKIWSTILYSSKEYDNTVRRVEQIYIDKRNDFHWCGPCAYLAISFSGKPPISLSVPVLGFALQSLAFI